MKKIKGGITYPRGYRQSALNCGIKKKSLDLALILSEKPGVCAAFFTSNKFKAAPVLLDENHIKAKSHRAVIINSGNANCLTGKAGFNDALLTAKRLSCLLGCGKKEVLVCSTGIIGKRMPVKKIITALPSLAKGASKADDARAAKAIMTTDTFSKEVAYSFKAGEKNVRVAGIAKGAGMIEPNLATMLSVITTDAIISKGLLKSAMREAIGSSFNCITVDGDMSTNDTVIVMANGSSGVNVASSKIIYEKFISALKAVCLDLAKMIVRDGEGATKFIEIEVRNAKNRGQAKRIALKIANSNLFKTMCYGQDPNFGRVAAACGASSEDINPAKVDIYLDDKIFVKSGTAVDGKSSGNIFKKKDIRVAVCLNIGKARVRVFTSDLAPEYIKINAAYS